MRVIVVGSNPSKNKSITKNSTIHRLYEWLSFIDVFSFTNVSCLSTDNNRILKKSEYQLKRLFTECEKYDIIVALGKTAGNALDKLGIEYFCLPHPSGLNRQINDKEFINDRLKSLQVYCSRRSTSDA